MGWMVMMADVIVTEVRARGYGLDVIVTEVRARGYGLHLVYHVGDGGEGVLKHKTA
jgi:hypothetical protein